MIEEVRIRVTSDDKPIDTTTEKLRKLGAVSDENAKKFQTANDKQKTALKETGSISTGLENQFKNLGATILAAFTVDAIIRFGKAALESFREAEKSANQLAFAVKNLGDGGADMFKRMTDQASKFQKISIFSDEQIQNAQTQLLQFGLTGKQVDNLIPKIIDLASAQGIDLAQATDKVIMGVNGQTKSLRDAGIAFKDTGSKTENLALLSQKLTKFQGATAVALNTSAGAAKNLENRFDDLMEGLGEQVDKELRRVKSSIVQLAEIFTVGFDQAIENSANDKLKELFSQRNKIIIEENTKGSEAQRLQAIANTSKRIVALQDEYKTANRERQKGIMVQLQMEHALNAELRKIHSERNTITNDLTLKGEGDAIESQKKTDDAILKAEEERKKQAIEDVRAQIKANAEMDKEQEKSAEDALKQKEDDKKKEEDLIREYDANQLALAKDLREEKKKITEQEKKDRIEMFEATTGAFASLLAAQNEMQLRSLDSLQEINTQARETQMRLAIEGKDNTLAFEDKQAAEIEKKRMDINRKMKRQKEFEVFLNSVAKFSESDPKTAIGKASAILALTKAYEATFMEEGGILGMGNQKSNFLTRKHKGGGDILVHAQKGEGFFSRADIANMGGEQAFLDFKKSLSLNFREKKIPIGAIVGSSFNDKNIVDRLNSLETTLKNKASTNVHWEGLHTMIVETTENGIKNATKYIKSQLD